MNPNRFNSKIPLPGFRLLSALALSLLILISSFGSLPNPAIAAPSQPQLMALFGSSRAEQLDDMAKTDVDKTFGAGTSNQLEGAAKQAQGKAQQDLQKTQSGFKGAEGKAKQDLGRTQSATGDLQKNVESAADDAQDAVKSFFGQ